MKHVKIGDLALHAGGDLDFVRSLRARLHLRNCQACRAELESFRAAGRELKSAAEELPANLNWDRLAREMTGNIRVGLAASEAIQKPKRDTPLGWKPAVALGAAAFLISSAWWLNMSPAMTQSLFRAAGKVARWETGPHLVKLEPGLVIEATSAGVEVRENGSTMSLRNANLRPVSVSVQTEGSARARYIDNDTGQVTITSVYVQE
ncbi:MAG: hypothetical protein K2X35_02465 [Bryobacteraceae bacterium]|nr:hypothetical protein [Bryobacteraceae bacterium]